MEVVELGKMDYDGRQLHHAFAYEMKGILGPTISSFIGEAAVKEHLVDLEDSLADDFIRSKSMAHFIIEIPGADIREAVVWQRLFIHMIASDLKKVFDITSQLKGDDILIDGKKLSVSIATLSRFSALIHVGINIDVGEGCPVVAVGLNEFSAFPDESCRFIWVNRIAKRFAEEYTDIVNATYKVIEVK